MATIPRGPARRIWRWRLQTALVSILAFMGGLESFAACGGSLSKDNELTVDPAAGGTGPRTGVTRGGSGGTSAIDPGNSSPPAAGASGCTIEVGAEPSFPDETYGYAKPWPTVLYSWTTKEQVAELVAGKALFSRSERTGLGRGLVFDSLAAFATSTTGEAATLATLLGSQVFQTARFAWSNAWATRMGWPGENYGDKLIQIQLRPTAWIVEFDGTYLSVTDSARNPISLSQALATPERIGAIYFVRGASVGGPSCAQGTFGITSGGNGYREFVLGNLAMIRRWSVGTAAITEAMLNDVDRLSTLVRKVSACPVPAYYDGWNAEVVCGWALGDTYSLTGYYGSLSLPSKLYYPDLESLNNLIATLKSYAVDYAPLEVDLGP